MRSPLFVFRFVYASCWASHGSTQILNSDTLGPLLIQSGVRRAAGHDTHHPPALIGIVRASFWEPFRAWMDLKSVSGPPKVPESLPKVTEKNSIWKNHATRRLFLAVVGHTIPHLRENTPK